MKTKLLFFAMIIWAQLAHAQFSKVFEFNGVPNLSGAFYAKPVFDGTYLYEMTAGGGQYDKGAIFRVKPDGSDLSILYDFDSITGQAPCGSLLLSGGVLYGMTSRGGPADYGCIFRINPDGSNFSKLLDFDGTAKGSYPYGTLIASDTLLYGMTSSGGTYGGGCIFRISKHGVVFEKLCSFIGAIGNNPKGGSLAILGDTVYGMTRTGGSSSGGVVFKMKTDGTGYSNFLNLASGSYPSGSITLKDSILYGMCSGAGTSSMGYIFRIKVDGTNYGVLHDFTGTADGMSPYGSLTILDSALYGMTNLGGANSNGCIFKLKLNGTSYTKMYDLSSTIGSYPYGSFCLSDTTLYGLTTSGTDGSNGGMFKINIGGTGFENIVNFKLPGNGETPYACPVQSGDTLFGTTNAGGAYNLGCIYRVNIDGTGYVKLLDFQGVANGASSYGPLTLSGNTLYGMTYSGGANDLGCIFKINTNGTGYTKLLDFDGATHGSHPYGSLILVGDTLYGATAQGGTEFVGCIFKIDINGNNYRKVLDFSTFIYGSDPRSIMIAGSTIFGATFAGGANTSGCIYKVKTDGTGYTRLVDGDGLNTGANYSCKLVLSGNKLYGTAVNGGASSQGCLFSIDTTGSNFNRMFDFFGTNGKYPTSSLTLIDTTLYGLAQGGTNNFGCMFKIGISGTNYEKILDFSALTSGSSVTYGRLLNYKNTLYGVTQYGGGNANGVLFRYVLTPTVQATNIITPVATTFSWTNGNGVKRAVFIKAGTGAITNPSNNTTYIASSDWNSKGSELGTSGYYCVYNGDGNSVALTNLPGDADYTIQVFEYNGEAGLEQYLTTTATGNPVTIHIKIGPEITWSNPADIDYGTLLSATQLNATANVSGTFVYTPTAGTLLNIGNNQILSVDFSPADTTNYYTASKTVTINVIDVTGIMHLQKDGIMLYPNPSDHYLTIGNISDEAYQITIFDLSGACVFNTQSTTTKQVIDVSKWSQGMYIIRITGATTTMEQKFLKN